MLWLHRLMERYFLSGAPFTPRCFPELRCVFGLQLNATLYEESSALPAPPAWARQTVRAHLLGDGRYALC